MNKKKMTAGVLALVMMAALFGGCGKSVAAEDYATTVVATFGEENIYLDEANFVARYTQYNYETYYLTLFGDGFWSADLTGTGATMEEVVKEDAMSQLFQTKYLCSLAEEMEVALTADQEAKVAEAVTKFMEEMPEEMITASMATEELATRVFTENALANLVWEAMVADVEIEDLKVEDFLRKDIQFLYVTAGSDKETALTDEELKEIADEIQERVEDGDKMEDIKEEHADAEGYKVTITTTTIAENTYDNDMGKAAWAMATGDIETVFVEEAGYYVVTCTDDNNEDAAEEAMQTTIDSRKSKLFQEKYTDLLEDAPEFAVVDDVWAVIKFKDAVYVETEAETEAE